ncbi:MAG: aldehyde dehydrogenase family protein [Candidatus Sumerlaeia bacterium]
MWIGGRFVKTGDVLDVRAPWDGALVGRVHRAGRAEVLEAIEAAHEAFERTRSLPAHVRAAVCERVRDQIVRRYDEIVRVCSLECGKPVSYTKIEIDRAISTFDLAGKYALTWEGQILQPDVIKYGEGRVTLVRRFPIGVVGAITPFNWPLNLLAHKAAPAIATGNTMVLRPASQTPLTAHLLGEMIAAAGWPAGGFNVVPCSHEAADVLLEDERVRMISFTGSPEVGWALKGRAPKKKFALELGNNGAAILDADADLSWAVPRIAVGAFHYAGQNCISVQRVFAHERIFTDVKRRLLKVVKDSIKWGDPMLPDTVVGPMISAREADRVMEWIAEARAGGARVLCGGRRHGNVIEPTILTRTTPSMKVNRLEVFAPLMTLEPWCDFDALLAHLNEGRLGIHCGLFTRDIGRAFRAWERLEMGGVIINDYPTFRVDNLPYGGVKDSGCGREGVKFAMEEMTELKHMTINLTV